MTNDKEHTKDWTTLRRIRIDLMTPAELAIRDAVSAVEDVGAHVLLTDAVNLLQQAREKVADYVDSIQLANLNSESAKAVDVTGGERPALYDMLRLRKELDPDAPDAVVVENHGAVTSPAGPDSWSAMFCSRHRLNVKAKRELDTFLASIMADPPYPCPRCNALTVNIATPPDISIGCRKCGWEAVTATASLADLQSSALVDYAPESERQVARARQCLQRWAASDRDDDSVETLHEITRIIK